jgi:hypothetical protein
MTPRERKDMPWLVAALAIVVFVILAGALLRWH